MLMLRAGEDSPRPAAKGEEITTETHVLGNLSPQCFEIMQQ